MALLDDVIQVELFLFVISPKVTDIYTVEGKSFFATELSPIVVLTLSVLCETTHNSTCTLLAKETVLYMPWLSWML